LISFSVLYISYVPPLQQVRAQATNAIITHVQNNTNIPKTHGNVSFLEYEDNSTLGVKIEYPVHWHANRIENNTAVFLAPLSPYSAEKVNEQGATVKKIFPVLFFVQVQDLPSQIDYLDNYISQYVDNLKDNSLVSSTPNVTLTNLAGNLAHNITYTATVGSTKYHTTEIIMLSGLKKYDITYFIAAQPKYTNYLSAIQPMLDSIQININTTNWTMSSSTINTDNNSALELRIQYPSNWEKLEYDDRGILFLSPSESISDKFRESLGIAIIPSTNISLPELANQQLNSYKELYPDFQLVESKPTTFKGNQAYMLQYIYTDKLFGRVKAMDLGFINGGNAFIISYFGDPSKFYNYIPTTDKDFKVIFFLMPNGAIYLDEPYSLQTNLTKNNYAYRDHYRGAIETQNTYLGNILISTSTGLPTPFMSVPIYLSENTKNNSSLIGIWAGGLNLRILNKSCH
jgi:hypothetical protein